MADKKEKYTEDCGGMKPNTLPRPKSDSKKKPVKKTTKRVKR